MRTFVLILCTLGGRDTIERMITSALRAARGRPIVLLLVDQSVGGVSVRLPRAENLLVEVVKSAPGLSRGRNAALEAIKARPLSEDVVVCFPDDDCWYPESVFDKVDDLLDSIGYVDAVCGRWCDPAVPRSSERWPKRTMPVTRGNVFSCASSVTIFIKLSAIRKANVRFDERLGAGAGTAWGSGEETDFLLHVLKSGTPVSYAPELCVYHPYDNAVIDAARVAKARRYANGTGRVMRIHGYSMYAIIMRSLRTSMGLVRGAVSADLWKCRLHWVVLVERFRGYFSGDC